ncbi:MAG TPA: DUF1289 domain-containing protein [Patescibacteria group bacterium]|nr:DUF1289 domain-containing protein [Patescibacteria group bacterium]
MITSPCIKICSMDQSLNVCIGCWRTLDEIARWGRADDDEKREILKAIEERRRILLQGL